MFASSITPSDSSKTALTNSTAYKMTSDDFMELLVTELQHQDPMDPVSTSEMASQFASLSQVSQLNETNDYLKSLSHSQAVDYLGKTISYLETNSDGTTSVKTSLVNGVVYKDGTPYLVTQEGKQITLSTVSGVS